MAKNFVALVGVLLCCSALFGLVMADDASLFVTLWDQINSFVTPKFPEFKAYETAPEVFIMNLPGFSINPNDYDEAAWKAGNYVESDPDYNAFQLTDTIPLNFPYFVDSGRRVSQMFYRFLRNYVTPIKDDPLNEDKITQYKNAMRKIVNDDFTPSKLAAGVNATRNQVKDSLNQQTQLRNECLYNDEVPICQRKAVYWQDALSDLNMLYLVTSYEMVVAQSKIFAFTSRNMHTLVFQQFERYSSAVRSSVGAKSFLGDYLQVRYDPTNWYTWWYPEFRNQTDAAFASIGVVSETSKSSSSSSFSRASFSASGTVFAYGVSVTPGVSRSTTSGKMKATASGQTVKISFELAAVRVVRSWFDVNIFDYSPLGIAGADVAAYSDGNYKGSFPWFISKMIIARNIKISQGSWESDVSSAFQSASTDVSMKVSYGPFTAGANAGSSSSSSNAESSFGFRNNELTIIGPQIIGYVCTKIPKFPNWAETTA